MLDPKVFKAYDVRGLYGTELDEEGAYAIARAFVDEFEPRRIAIGRDMRVSSPTMAAALIDGAADGGADVVGFRNPDDSVVVIGVNSGSAGTVAITLDDAAIAPASMVPHVSTSGSYLVERPALNLSGATVSISAPASSIFTLVSN